MIEVFHRLLKKGTVLYLSIKVIRMGKLWILDVSGYFMLDVETLNDAFVYRAESRNK